MRNREAVIISDNKLLGDLEEILAASGYDAVVVDDALSAVDIVVQRRPDVILLELKMPSKSGFEIAGEINHTLATNRIPIIAMSSFFKNEFRFLLDLCGINGHLKKPFHPLDVIWAVENVTTERYSDTIHQYNKEELMDEQLKDKEQVISEKTATKKESPHLEYEDKEWQNPQYGEKADLEKDTKEKYLRGGFRPDLKKVEDLAIPENNYTAAALQGQDEEIGENTDASVVGTDPDQINRSLAKKNAAKTR